MFSPELLDHFQNPRNVGRLPTANACARRENPVCGDVLEVALLAEEGVIQDIRFLAKGCVPSMACGSALTELVRGATLAQAALLTREDIAAAVGGLERHSTHAAQLALETLQAALRQIFQR